MLWLLFFLFQNFDFGDEESNTIYFIGRQEQLTPHWKGLVIRIAILYSTCKHLDGFLRHSEEYLWTA